MKIQKAEGRRQKAELGNRDKTVHCSLFTDNEKGIALVIVLILSAIGLATMAGLIYMVTSGTQISGIQKRYNTALEAGLGGVDVAYQVIGARGDPGIPLTEFYAFVDGFAGVSACLNDKLNNSTADWNVACQNSLTITPGTTTTYDMRFDIGAAPVYRVYSKIVDTVEGNSGGDEGLEKCGVNCQGEVTVMSIPYLYTIEVDAQNAATAERAKLSILYQY